MAAIPAYALRAHPKVDGGARSVFFEDAAVPLSIRGKNLWEGALILGAGGEGTAALFVQFDGRNTVEDRIAAKEVACGPENWWFPLNWAGAYDPIGGYRDYSAKIDHSEASETYIHRKLSKKISDCILEYRGRSRVYDHQWRWRLYSEFCAHGTLQSLIQHYRKIGNFASAQEFVWDGTASGLPNVLIPEPFIWYCALSLAKAAQIMEKGSDTAASERGWREIIHRDIKPGNVFLSEAPTAQGGAWPLYPAVKLADFGHSVETNVFDPNTNNPRSYRTVSGTPGFIPPEQRYEWHYRGTRDHYDTPALSAKTNVYSIGMTLWALMYRHHPSAEREFSDASHFSSPADLLKQLVDPGDHGLAGDGYSQPLIDLVQDCIRANDRSRPSPNQLRARVEANSALFESMRNVVPTPGEPWYSNSAGGEHILAGLKQDDYRLGLAREDLPSDSSVDSDPSDAGHGNL